MSRAKRKEKYNRKQQDNTINFNEAYKQRNIELRPKSINQEKLILNLLDGTQSIVVATGPAGTGKTYLAMLAAIKAFRLGHCERIILTRPAVGVDDEKHGFLPGDLNSKMEPWTRPLFDVLREYYSAKEVTAMLENQTIEISPLAFMRGRTFKDAWIIADEMQNATPSQNSKIVITGDVEQTDRTVLNNGLIDLCKRLETKREGLAVCYMTNKDIQRHPIIDTVLELYAT
jgi:phosphate starvation-inducible protein PhoH and related proteins